MTGSDPSDESARISLGLALVPLVALVTGFALAAATIGLTTEILIVVMLAAACVAGAIAVWRGGSWREIERATGKKLGGVLPMILILLSIGMLIATWVSSGTIPYLVAWGVRLVDPRFFALLTFVVTAVMSLCTGTSWGSAGTLGVALMGAAAALDVPLAMAAGAVVSGAYLGDKMSPLSDTTNICALAAGADLYSHIRHMLYTAVPSALLASAVYLIAGARSPGAGVHGGELPVTAVRLAGELESSFELGLLPLLPLLVVVAAILVKVPPALALSGSSAVALLLAVFLQGFSVPHALAAAVTGFDPIFLGDRGVDASSLSPDVSSLLARGGLYSMAPTLVVILAAFLFAAALEVSGALERILSALLSVVRSTFGLIASTMASGALMISLTSHGGVTALVLGEMFEKAYRKRDLAPENLSRSLEDSVTIVEPILPWTVSGIFMSTTLGVPTGALLPWAVFCWGGSIFSLLLAATFDRTGFGLTRLR